MNNIGNIRPSDGEIDQTANKMTVSIGVIQRDPLIRLKLQVSSIGVATMRVSEIAARARRSEVYRR